MGACAPRKGKVLIVLLAHHDIKSGTPAAKSIPDLVRVQTEPARDKMRPPVRVSWPLQGYGQADAKTRDRSLKFNLMAHPFWPAYLEHMPEQRSHGWKYSRHCGTPSPPKEPFAPAPK